MKRWVLFVLILFLPDLAEAELNTIGTVFTKVNAYVYDDGPERGKRILVRAREAYEATDVAKDGRDRVWFQILLPARQKTVAGEGWTPFSPAEIQNAGTEAIPVYATTFDRRKDDTSRILVPPENLKFLNETKNSKPFPEIIWQKVKYSTKKATAAWIRGSSVFYRAGKELNFIQRSYEEMVSRNIKKETLLRLISGVVRVGDSEQNVNWALGKPLRVQEQTAGETARMIWHFTTMEVQFRDKVVERIN